jgi:hypothetical protein
MNEQTFISALKNQFNGEQLEFRGTLTLLIQREQLLDVASKVREMGF